MRSPQCKIVQNVLIMLAAMLMTTLEGIYIYIYILQSKWRTQDMKITEALNEIKDNVKYLITLEPFITPLYEENSNFVKILCLF